jgi:hypothetical protein
MEQQGGGEPAVLFISGSGRSGSTLLECMLAEMPGVVALGEVGHLWERALLGNERCACTRAFSDCPFWSEVGESAFGGWQEVDGRRMLALKDAVDRQRRLLLTARRRTPERIAEELRQYTDHYRRVYDAAAKVSGAAVVIDSTKESPTAMALSHHAGIDLRVLHIVRDSRGVAYSWQKSVQRPEKDGADMPRLSPAVSTEWWLVHNGGVAGLRRRGVPVSRLRYEELVERPARIVRRAWGDLGLPGDGDLPMIDDTSIELTGSHSVAGNPMRFRTGPTRLRPDTAWISELSTADRRVVTALSLPLLKWYGYPLRIKD